LCDGGKYCVQKSLDDQTVAKAHIVLCFPSEQEVSMSEPLTSPIASGAFAGRATPRGALERRFPPHVSTAVWLAALVAVAVIAGYTLTLSLQSPGTTIRHELTQAAGEMHWPGAEPRQSDLSAILGHFADHRATLDTAFWPDAIVTLHGLDRATCIDAKTVAGRIEGLVVVELDRHTAAAECRATNDMSSRIMP